MTHKVLYTHGATALDSMMTGVDVLGETGATSVTFFSLDIERYAQFIRERGVKVWLMMQWEGGGEADLPKIQQYVRDCIAAFGRENIAGVSIGDEWDWKMREASAEVAKMPSRILFDAQSMKDLGRGHRWMELNGSTSKVYSSPQAFPAPQNYSPEMARKRNEAVKEVDPTLETWINVIGDMSGYIVEARAYAASGADHVTFDFYSRICENADNCAGWCAPQPETPLALTGICAWFAEKPLAPNQKWGLGVQCFDMTACDRMPRTTAALMRADYDRAAPLGKMGLVYAYCWSDFGRNRNDLLREPKLRPECKTFFGGLDAPAPEKPPAIFEPSNITIRVGDVVPIRVLIPPGRKVKRFEIDPADLVDGWPAELPEGAAGWTLNGRMPGKGVITCVLDDGGLSVLVFEVLNAAPPPEPVTPPPASETFSGTFATLSGRTFKFVGTLTEVK